MLGRFFNRYTALAVGVQISAIVQTWIVAFAISPVGDKYFGLMFSFYLPPAYVAFELLKLPIVSGIVGGAIHGFILGILIYGFLFGFGNVIVETPLPVAQVGTRQSRYTKQKSSEQVSLLAAVCLTTKFALFDSVAGCLKLQRRLRRLISEADVRA